jgi:hypothetical protein
MDLEVADEFAKIGKEIINEGWDVGSFKKFAPFGTYAKASRNAYAHANKGYNFIQYKASLYKKADNVVKETRKNVRYGWSPDVKDQYLKTQNLNHEIAHMIADRDWDGGGIYSPGRQTNRMNPAIKQKMREIWSDHMKEYRPKYSAIHAKAKDKLTDWAKTNRPTIRTQSERRAWNKVYDAKHKEYMGDLLQILKKENPDEWKDFVSFYAFDKPDEMWAECFTQFRMGKTQSKYTKQMIELMKEMGVYNP